jgi:hypothetical protein
VVFDAPTTSPASGFLILISLKPATAFRGIFPAASRKEKVDLPFPFHGSETMERLGDRKGK